MALAETDARSEAGAALPRWDLSDLYPARDAPEVAADLERSEAEARTLQERYQGRVAELDGAELGELVAAYERVEETLGRLSSYAHLLHACNMDDPEVGKFFQTVRERVTDISTHLLFVTLEINRIEEDALAEKLKAPALSRYAPWVRDVRAFREHQLSDELERLLHEKAITGRAAWMRLFDETMAALRFPVGVKNLTTAEVLNLLSHKDGAVRKEAAKSLGRVLGDNIRLFALVTNTLAKDKEIQDRWRKFPRPISSRNLSNFVEDEVVDALTMAVRDAYPRLSHRYYRVKARWFGVDRLDYWDRNAPLPEDDDRHISWSDARDLVLDAYAGFSARMAEVARPFFERGWIDAPVYPGKASGAFSHPTVPSAHPYILMNYQEKTRDVMTLAHELGHGVHQVLAGRQGALLAETPLTLAETASVFGEQLTFRRLLREAEGKRRRILLASKVEDSLNTVVRQIAFCQFETRVHDERRRGELTPDQLGEIWMGVQTESLGPAFRYDDEYRHFWSYIPHFIHAPFYVYAYAFGECLVNSLYAVYERGADDFVGKYLEMLAAGGTLRHRDLLRPFGLDASDPAFWAQGLGLIEGLIDELEGEI
jgi:oligoendopeptidase F